MKNNPIGILDSGVGGLTVLQAIRKELPRESIIAIADSGNAPYGGRSVDFITDQAEWMVEFLLEKKAKLIVIACNTITVTSLEKLRKKYPAVPIVGVVPVIKTAVEMTRNKRIGVLSTTTTAQSLYQKKLIESFASGCHVFNYGTDALVPLIEAGELASGQVSSVLHTTLAPFIKEKIDILALGCTHFPLVRTQIKSILGNRVQVLDSGGAVARQVKRVSTENNLLSQKKPEYSLYTAGDPAIAKKIIASTIEELQGMMILKYDN